MGRRAQIASPPAAKGNGPFLTSASSRELSAPSAATILLQTADKGELFSAGEAIF